MDGGVEEDDRFGRRKRTGLESNCGRGGDALAIPAAGSLEEFIVEHYWGYVRGRDGETMGVSG